MGRHRVECKTLKKVQCIVRAGGFMVFLGESPRIDSFSQIGNHS
jgi:hypothetical protein